MTDNQSDPARGRSPLKEGLTLSSLYPAKVQVHTSVGSIFVRKMHGGDWKSLASDEAEPTGAQALRLLCNREEDKRSYDPLSDEDFTALAADDIRALACAISDYNGWGGVSAEEPLPELWSQVATARQKKLDIDKGIADSLRKSLASDYSFLNSSALSRLQDQMAELSALRENTYKFNALKESDELAAIARKAFAPENSLRRINLQSPQFKMPEFEDTPLGMAMADSVRASEETAREVNDLVGIVAGLNSTIVSVVLPAWFKHALDGQKSSDDAVRQAASSLWWTKWAVAASVVATLGATWWQVSVAKDMDRENGAQQKKVELLLREQLAGQQKQIELQAAQAKAMQQSIVSLKLAVPSASSNKKQRR